MIIKSANCIHASSDVTSAVTLQDSRNKMNLLSRVFKHIWPESVNFQKQQSAASVTFKTFLILIPMPSPWWQPVFLFPHTNQTKANMCTQSEPFTLPLTSTLLFLHIMPFFLKVEASCWNLDSIHLQCERSCQVQAMTHTRKKDTLWFPNSLINYGFRQMTDVRYWIMSFWKCAITKCS